MGRGTLDGNVVVDNPRDDARDWNIADFSLAGYSSVGGPYVDQLIFTNVVDLATGWRHISIFRNELGVSP